MQSPLILPDGFDHLHSFLDARDDASKEVTPSFDWLHAEPYAGPFIESSHQLVTDAPGPILDFSDTTKPAIIPDWIDALMHQLSQLPTPPAEPSPSSSHSRPGYDYDAGFFFGPDLPRPRPPRFALDSTSSPPTHSFTLQDYILNDVDLPLPRNPSTSLPSPPVSDDGKEGNSPHVASTPDNDTNLPPSPSSSNHSGQSTQSQNASEHHTPPPGPAAGQSGPVSLPPTLVHGGMYPHTCFLHGPMPPPSGYFSRSIPPPPGFIMGIVPTAPSSAGPPPVVAHPPASVSRKASPVPGSSANSTASPSNVPSDTAPEHPAVQMTSTETRLPDLTRNAIVSNDEVGSSSQVPSASGSLRSTDIVTHHGGKAPRVRAPRQKPVFRSHRGFPQPILVSTIANHLIQCQIPGCDSTLLAARSAITNHICQHHLPNHNDLIDAEKMKVSIACPWPGEHDGPCTRAPMKVCNMGRHILDVHLALSKWACPICNVVMTARKDSAQRHIRDTCCAKAYYDQGGLPTREDLMYVPTISLLNLN